MAGKGKVRSSDVPQDNRIERQEIRDQKIEIAVRYRFELNEKQLFINRDALEFYSRFLSGQLEYLPDSLKFKVARAGKSDELREALNALKRILFPGAVIQRSGGCRRAERRSGAAHQTNFL